MSSLDDLLKESQEEDTREMEAQGLSEEFDAWRESVPDGRMPNEDVKDLFKWAQEAEDAAQSGQLQAISGGEPIGVGTTPATPGPDDDGDSPDAAGEVSKGGDGDPTDIELVPGMWTPPENSEAENYEPQSTREMVKGDMDWMRDAKKYWKFMGEPNINKPFVSGSGNVSQTYFGDVKDMSDQDIARWAAKEVSMFNWNVVSTMASAQKIMTSDDTESALSFLNLLNMYDHSDGGFMEFFGALGGIGTDPTTYAGLGVGAVGAKGAAKALAKTKLKQSIKLGITAAAGGATEGGFLTGGFDLSKQNVEKEAGAREEIDLGQTAGATAIGIGAGTLLGGGIGYAIGRKIDKMQKLLDEQLHRTLGFKAEEAARVDKDMSVDQFMETIEAIQRASAMAGKPDDMVVTAMKMLEAGGEVPRTPTGEIDVVALEKILGRRKTDIPVNDPAVRGMDEPAVPGGRGARAADDIPEGEAGDLSPNIARATEVVSEAPVVKTLDGTEAPVEPGMTRMYRGTSDTQGFDDVFKKGALAPPDRPGKFFTEDMDVADYYRDAFNANKDARIDYVDVPTDKVESMRFSPASEFIIDVDNVKFNRTVTRKVTTEGKAPQKVVPDEESQALSQRILELDELEKGDVVLKGPGRKGSTIRDKRNGEEFELTGRTKNGWYKGVSRYTGAEHNFRRKNFDVIEKAPAPEKAGPMDLSPFSDQAAKIIAMGETIHGDTTALKQVKVTTKEIESLAADMQKVGIDIAAKDIASHWTPQDLVYLRNTYNAQAHGIADLARRFESLLRNGGHLDDAALAYFNAAHMQFVATRDLFYGVRGNAARQLRMLKERPKGADSYDFSEAILNTIQTQGGRANTERAIRQMADYVALGKHAPGSGKTVGNIHQMSVKMWGEKLASAILAVRYNVMLSSWRTHFFNFLGNSASGVYEHMAVSPTRGVINNMAYAKDLAKHTIIGTSAPDKATRYRMSTWKSELKGHRAAFRDSLALAKEIAAGRDIGEGKIWNELGLRYDIINVPTSVWGKVGTTPVRMLEAGDALFKNQYHSARIHYLADQKARYDEIYRGKNYEEQYNWHANNPDAQAMREAKDYASKMTYTNDPNVYEGVFAALARGAQSAQANSLAVNMVLPFVRTPANLLSFSMEMTGLNTVTSNGKFISDILSSDARIRQDAMAKLVVAAGMWVYVMDAVQDGRVSGSGPSNWEEKKAWEAAGWQANSIKMGDTWVDLSRAQPAGQALTLMATVVEQLSLMPDDRQGMAWIGAGIMAAADQIKDESYLSTFTDFIVAVESKDEARWRSLGASTLNSFYLPNIARDVRRVTDPVDRTMKSPDVMTQVVKQMKNATFSHSLAPDRDWKGEVKHYYGNAYVRALVPFNMRDASKQDQASMALAYAGVPISTPSVRLSMPGTGNFVDLMAMDNGDGYVYDKYVEFTGKGRAEAVDKLMSRNRWKRLVKEDNIGPGSDGDTLLRRAIAIGSRIGRVRMLQFLIEHSGNNDTYELGNGDLVLINHQFSKKQYVDLLRAVRREDQQVPEDLPQYKMRERQEGVEFFKP